MGTRSTILSVKLLVDNANAKKGFGEAETSLGKFQDKVGKLTAPAAAVVGGIVALGKTTTDSASRAEQAMGGLDSVFGDSAGKMKDFAKQAATTAGLSTSQYGELATKVGASLKNMGVPVDEIGDKTNDLIKQGADLAATFGGTTEEAVSALGAAMRGEADPAERYGLALSQTAVNAKLAEKGQDKLTGSAKSQAKATAILDMVTQQAGGALGQFARESEGAAGSSQIAAAQAENAKAALGTALLPVVVAVSTAFGTLSTFISENTQLVQIAVAVIGGFAVAILAVSAATKAWAAGQKVVAAATKAWAAVQWLLNAAMSANPIALIIIAVIAFVAVIVVLWKKCEGFRTAVIAVWNAIKTAAVAVWTAIKTVIGAVIEWIKRTIQAAGRIIGAVWTAIKTAAAAAWNAIKVPIAAVIEWIAGKVRGIVTTVKTWWDKLKGLATTAWNAVKQPVADLIKWIVDKWNTFLETIGKIWDKLKGLAKTAWDAVKTPIEAVIKWVTDTWDDLVGAVGKIWDKITAAITTALAPVKAVIDGIKAAWDTTVGAISGAIEKVKGWLDGILSKIADIGKKEIAGKAVKAGTSSIYTPAPTMRYASAGLSAGALSGPTAAAPSSAGGTTINVYGALDADNVARQIQQILAGRVRRVGPVRLGGVTL